MSRLIVVPTPVGNLQDITLRALDVLRSADIILAEDTRISRFLLQHFKIEKRILAHHQHNEHQALGEIIRLIKDGAVVAQVSDAGTPGISDPGYLLIRECIRENIPVEVLPGPTAFVPALVLSGLPGDKFVFEGFLPQKKGRQTRLNFLKDETRTMIFYESPYRLVKFLGECQIIFGENRQASVSREITKLFEETQRGTLAYLHQYFSLKTVKGEIAVVVAGLNFARVTEENQDKEI